MYVIGRTVHDDVSRPSAAAYLDRLVSSRQQFEASLQKTAFSDQRDPMSQQHLRKILQQLDHCIETELSI